MDEKNGPIARSEWNGCERVDGPMGLFSVKRTRRVDGHEGLFSVQRMRKVDGLEAHSVSSGREEPMDLMTPSVWSG